jgi:hypothetical protein
VDFDFLKKNMSFITSIKKAMVMRLTFFVALPVIAVAVPCLPQSAILPGLRAARDRRGRRYELLHHHAGSMVAGSMHTGCNVAVLSNEVLES